MHTRNESITNECPKAEGDMYLCMTHKIPLMQGIFPL